jgi:hypothetical protein
VGVKNQVAEEQIIALLRKDDRGVPVMMLCRKHGFSEPS